jgi:hypothetical protein
MFMALRKCKAWIESTMAMLGARITTYIKNKFGLNFRKIHRLSQLHCVHDDCENFVHSNAHNELFWCGECVYIPIVGLMELTMSTPSFGCKFCHAPPLCVINYNG